MHPVGIIICSALTACVIGAFSIGLFKTAKEPGRLKWLIILCLFVTALGLAELSVTGLAASDGLRWLPSSFEWPVGSSTTFLAMPDNEVGVPLTLIGRIQVYDANGKFLRGAWVDFDKGNIGLKKAGTNMVELITKNDSRDPSDLNSGSHDFYKSWEDVPLHNGPIYIPTSWWLWSLEKPIYSWFVMTGGLAVLTVARLFEAARAKKAKLKEALQRDI